MNNRKIFYITKSYPPEANGGGGLVRSQTVELLRKSGFEVTVVVLTQNAGLWEGNKNVIPISISSSKNVLRTLISLEYLGVIPDFLYPWVGYGEKKLKNIIQSEDIILCASGGELGTIMLGSKLKKSTGAKFVINLHDPISHTKVLGNTLPGKFHVNRDDVTFKYLNSSDAIVTSSELYKNEILTKINNTEFYNWYFGYSGSPERSLTSYTESEKLVVVYAGNMNRYQKPERLIEFMRGSSYFNKIEFHFFGSGTGEFAINKYAEEYSNVFFHGQKSQEEVHNFYRYQAHIGFVSLFGDYFKPFVPSKMYDYIQYQLPVLGLLPDGDASAIIETLNIGISCVDEQSLVAALEEWICNPSLWQKHKSNIAEQQERWSMEYTSDSLIQALN